MNSLKQDEVEELQGACGRGERCMRAELTRVVRSGIQPLLQQEEGA